MVNTKRIGSGHGDSPARLAVIVTGGGRGIGRAISLRLANTYAVLVVGRSEPDLQATCDEITANGGTARYVAGDVGVKATADNAVRLVEELGWQLHSVICNAGVGKSSVTHELSADTWHDTFSVNVDGAFNFAQAALPLFVQQHGGVLCFINSIAGIKSYPYEAAYTASKHAVVGLAQSIALEYGKHGITSVAICPGFVESDMTERTINGLAARRGISHQEARQVIEKLNPQRRIIPAGEVAAMVDFVCRNKVPSLSGSCVVMSGGA